MYIRLFALFALFLPVVSRAATINVTVAPGGANRFSPTPVTIQVGDTVRWTWQENNHSVTSGTPGNPNGIFDLAVRNNGFVFSFVFATAGNFPYYCRVHGSMMTGTVNVAAPTPTPTPDTNADRDPASDTNSDAHADTDSYTNTHASTLHVTSVALPADFHCRERIDQH